jgi:hypothetical protein
MLADELDVSRNAITKAKKLDAEYPGRLRRLRVRILSHLLGAEIDGPFFRVTFPARHE